MKQAKKGSTVVLPSDFQSETTSNPLFRGDSRHFSHGCARADARTLAPEDINILIACEESQAECKAFRRLGFNAYSCDIRSRTFPQVADAIAKQWGDFILAELNNSIIG